ncbi:hypothetical protein D3C81_1881870 [compost metagenome]
MVDALLAVRHTAATAKMHYHPEPALFTPGIELAMGIGAVEVAFQAVEQHHSRLAAGLSRIFAPGEIDKVAVGQFQPLPVGFQLHAAAHQPWQQRLQVWITGPGQRAKGFMHNLSKILIGNYCGMISALIASLA